MPALEIILDGVTTVTVSTGELTMLTVNVDGTVIDEALASLNVSGGNYSESGSSTYLTWVARTPLQANQQVRVVFRQHGQSSQPGKTIAELYPDASSAAQTDFTPTAKMFEEIRATPKVREGFALHCRLSSGASFVGETMSGEFGFSLLIFWDARHPERARVSLHSYSLGSLDARGPRRHLLKENMTFGDYVELRVA
ncbi:MULTISPECIES: hypothetical protein [Burkholderia]|uniref:hypothetical protein n=1 Tax=Burkholderia TaxID=32008 RepID=UPI00103B749B|nr:MULTISPECIES: hypothetical protein [Burkholderia]